MGNPLQKLFASKHIVTANTPVHDYHASRYGAYQPFNNYVVFNNRPYWQKLSGFASLFDWFQTNPVFYACVMIKAREEANKIYRVRHRKTKEVEPDGTTKKIPARVYQLMRKPNPLQSTWEFNKQRKILSEVAGNSFTYGNAPLGFRPNIDNILTLFNVWPQYMEVILGNKYFEATQIEEVIKKWKFVFGDYKKEFEPWEIMMRNQPAITPRGGYIFGMPTAAALVKPLSNIDMAYESRNVIMRNRGMRAIISSDKGDASGHVPFFPDEEERMNKDFNNKYGSLEGQWQWMLTGLPVNVTPIDQDVMKLGLFEEISTDAMMVAAAFGVPEILVKLYLKGATFENQDTSVRRLYQGTLMPESADDDVGLNEFLGLDQTEWELFGSFDHIPFLQESENQKQDTAKKKSDLLIQELDKKLITMQEYWDRMGYGPMPAREDAPEDDSATRQAQATLRGSVGGVQGILAVQSAVAQGITDRDAAIAILEYVFGFTREQADQIIGNIQATEEQEAEVVSEEEQDKSRRKINGYLQKFLNGHHAGE